MPLKALKMRQRSFSPSALTALSAATSVAAAVAALSDMASFPPTRAAAALVLVILQTVQQLDANRTACYKLARRAARILLELKARMEGRWEGTPKALVDNIAAFESTLIQIRDFMQELSKVRWVGRLLQKVAIENAICDFDDLLSDAEKSFQTASLIEIHYTVGVLQQRSAGVAASFVEPGSIPEHVYGRGEEDETVTVEPVKEEEVIDAVAQLSLEPVPSGLEEAEDERELELSVLELQMDTAKEEDFDAQLEAELAELDSLGFKKYHQSAVRLKSKSRVKGSGAFWEGTATAEVDGQRAVVKRYEVGDAKDAAMKRWLHDLKTLKNLYHENLPQLVGYSDPSAATPFILLANVKMREPSAYLLHALQNSSIVECASATLKMYRDIASAVLYVQRQLALDERETQVFVAEASYAIDAATGALLVGIPPPPEANCFRGFGYRLTESLVGQVMQALPKIDSFKTLPGTSETSMLQAQEKLRHVRALTRALLPKAGQAPSPPPLIEALLSDSSSESDSGSDSDSEFERTSKPADKKRGRTLAQLREAHIAAGAHDVAFAESVHNCPVPFAVGDFGYIPPFEAGRANPKRSNSKFDAFVKLGNVYESHPEFLRLNGGRSEDEENRIEILHEASGSYGQWTNGFYQRSEAYAMPLPGDTECWPTSLAPHASLEVHVQHTARVRALNDAWALLMRGARRMTALAEESADVKPHQIILITKTTTGQIYRIRDCSPSFPLPGFGGAPRPGGFGFNHAPAHPHHMHAHAHAHMQMQMPRTLYLFTSYRPDFFPFWSDSPSSFAAPASARPHLRNVAETFGWPTPERYMEYIQLSEEDFV